MSSNRESNSHYLFVSHLCSSAVLDDEDDEDEDEDEENEEVLKSLNGTGKSSIATCNYGGRGH